MPKLELCEEALAAIDEAVAIRRELAAALPHVYSIPARIPVSQTAPDMIRWKPRSSKSPTPSGWPPTTPKQPSSRPGRPLRPRGARRYFPARVRIHCPGQTRFLRRALLMDLLDDRRTTPATSRQLKRARGDSVPGEPGQAAGWAVGWRAARDLRRRGRRRWHDRRVARHGLQRPSASPSLVAKRLRSHIHELMFGKLFGVSHVDGGSNARQCRREMQQSHKRGQLANRWPTRMRFGQDH
jgi:hypothetical protein